MKKAKQEWSKKEITYVLNKHKAGYSRNEIARMFAKHFVKEGLERSQDSIKHCIETHGQHIERDLPKVLCLDIETAPMKVYAWGVWDQNIPLNMIIEHSSILSWSAHWLGDPDNKIMYKDMRGHEKNISNDKIILQPLLKLMDEADIILGQNVKSFDLPIINGRSIIHELSPPSDYKVIDTLSLSKRYFKFTSNKLEHVSKILNKKHKKSKHKKFDGFSMWEECLKGNKAAWNEMQSYNKLDVLSTEEVFLKQATWVKNNKEVAAALRTYNAKKKSK